VKRRFGAWLFMDEAHAIGVLGPNGRGLAAAGGVDGDIDIKWCAERSAWRERRLHIRLAQFD
jgi:hypothetical protein